MESSRVESSKTEARFVQTKLPGLTIARRNCVLPCLSNSVTVCHTESKSAASADGDGGTTAPATAATSSGGGGGGGGGRGGGGGGGGYREVVSVPHEVLDSCWPDTMTGDLRGKFDEGVVVLPNDAEAALLTDPLTLEVLLTGRPKPPSTLTLGLPQAQAHQLKEQLRCLLRLSRVRG